jgi:hypothetical protein
VLMRSARISIDHHRLLAQTQYLGVQTKNVPPKK